jgi:hypothetical protein
MHPHMPPNVMDTKVASEIDSADASACHGRQQMVAKTTLVRLKMITGNDAKNAAENAADCLWARIESGAQNVHTNNKPQ